MKHRIVKLNLTYEDAKASNAKMIYYSAHSVFWTHDPEDLFKSPPINGISIPVDCFGSPLFQSDKVAEWFDDEKVRSCEVYGHNPFLSLMLCHAKNINLLPVTKLMKFSDVARAVDAL